MGQRRRGALRRKQHEQPVLPRQIEEMEQDLLVIGAAIGILDDDWSPRPHVVDGAHAKRIRAERLGSRPRLPHARQMRLAARGGANEKLDLIRPFGPGVDQLDRCAIAIADEEVLGVERRAMRQIERELGDRHEALTRERCGSSSLGAFLWRGGSGTGAGS